MTKFVERHRIFSQVRHPDEILGPIGLLPGALFFVKDAAYRYVFMSDGIREGIGLADGEDPVGKTDFDFFSPLIAESFRRNDRLVIEDGRILLDEVHVTVNRDGRTLLCYSSKWPLRDRDGRIIGLIGTNRRHETEMGGSGGDEAGRLLPAIQRMLHDFGARLPIESLARACGLSPSHFMRLFKAVMRVTAREFLEKVRISQATDLLGSTRLPVATIAERCGFYDHSAFVKRFRLHAGTTPLAFRKSRRRAVAGELAAAAAGPGRAGRRRSRATGRD
ncbi:MAG: helix-turn-helix domain-containing protein [Planctomycetia bacterium]